MKRFANGSTCSVAALAVLISSVPAQARTPNDLRDLIGARGSSGESELSNRGYEPQSTRTMANGVYSYWWNKSSNKCVRVLTSNGHYSAIDEASRSDCGKSGNNDAAAIAVGAVALAGIAALAASSRKKSNKSYDNYATGEYDRGYRDGYHHSPYNNYRHTDAYADGYTSGMGQRGYYPSYGSNYTGYRDLIGRSNDYVDNQLRARGYMYQGKDGAAGSGHERRYWQARVRQCIAVRTRSGTVEYIEQLNRRVCQRGY